MSNANVVMLSGSPNPVSRLTGLTRFAERRLHTAGCRITQIDAAALPAEDLIRARFDSPAIVEANRLIAEADAVIIATPVYKASYTGVLKTYLDLLPKNGLAGKLVTPLFIGGSIAHLLAIDYALKPVLAALGATKFTSGVYAVDSQVVRSTEPDGAASFLLDVELEERLDAVLQQLIEDLGVKIHA